MFDLVQWQNPAQRRQHLNRRVLVAAALPTQVVVGADPGQHRDLFTAQAEDAAVQPGRDARLLRFGQISAGA